MPFGVETMSLSARHRDHFLRKGYLVAGHVFGPTEDLRSIGGEYPDVLDHGARRLHSAGGFRRTVGDLRFEQRAYPLTRRARPNNALQRPDGRR